MTGPGDRTCRERLAGYTRPKSETGRSKSRDERAGQAIMAQESRSVAGFDSEADLRSVTENPHHHVHTARARVRARVQRLCDDERGIRRSKEIWGEIPAGSHGGSRARLPETAEDRRRLCGPGGSGGTLAVMEAIRKGTSNSKAVISACVTDA